MPLLHPRRAVLLLLLIAVTVLPLLGRSDAGASTYWIIITDQNFVATQSAFDDAAIQEVLLRVKSPLAAYQEPLGDDVFSAARAIHTASISQEDTLNPQVLLAILHGDGRLSQTVSPPFIKTLQDITVSLWNGYRAYQAGERRLTLASGLVVTMGEETNAATFGLASYYAGQARSENELRSLLDGWLQSFLFLFGEDPGLDRMTALALPDIEPFMQLPFKQPDAGFLGINSFFDHGSPTSLDDTMLRFDGKSFSGAGFSGCLLGVSCYGGHNGLDYSTGAGMPILAAAAGKVVYRYYNTDPSAGNVDSGLIIDHGNGYRTSYWHMDPIQVNLNDTIAQGQQIGLSGNIGKSSGAHLHFSLRLTSSNKSVDPYGWWSAGADTWGDSRWMWAGDLIADNREAQAQLFYRSFWYRDPLGYAGESYYTMSTDTTAKSTNWAIWGASIPAAGLYNVYAYWPSNAANTRSARYQIFHATGSTTVTVDQGVGGNEFVLIGSFSMGRGPVAVILTDYTGESGKRVYFDAIKWGLKSVYPPTDIKLSKTSIAENSTTGTPVASISTIDADAGDVHSYALVEGTGSTDNTAFSVSGSRLLSAVPLDFETKNSYSIRLRTTDSGGASFEKAFTIKVTNVNETPSSLSLSTNTALENMAAGTMVGAFSTTDQDSGDSHSYSLVSGSGSTDNGLYSISGNTLKTKTSFDYEAKTTHSIRVRVTDSGGLWFEQTFNIKIIDINEAPSNILLSKARVTEKLPIGALVGLLTAVDQDAGDLHSFSLVEGTGDVDNASFTISDRSLLTNEVFDLALKSSYSIRVRAVDRAGLSTESAFTITILPYNQPPNDITISKSAVPENQPAGTAVGLFATIDPNVDDTFTYMLVSGEGSVDNALFAITGRELKTAALFDFETRTIYSIRVRSADSGGLFTEKAFAVQITNVNEAPTSLSLSNTSVNENQPAGTTVGSLTSSDPDANDVHSYTLVSGTGSTDNSLFRISGSLLQTHAVFDFETRKTYSVRLRVTDAGGLYLERAFNITILDINDAPTALDLAGIEISENNRPGDEIGVLSTLDQDSWDSHTYTMVFGSGDSGNGAFTISGNRLLAAVAFDYETQTTYSIRLRVTDLGGLWYERSFTIYILPVNEYPPTSIELSRSSVPEHRPPGTLVGLLNAIDADHGDWHTFALVNGSGSQDNALFAISGNELRANVSFDYELRQSYAVRMRVTDSGGLWYEKAFEITVEDWLEYFFPLLP
jgi:murein DD-endopeptidase MepM/ murein hydrolase activator NlpD